MLVCWVSEFTVGLAVRLKGLKQQFVKVYFGVGWDQNGSYYKGEKIG